MIYLDANAFYWYYRRDKLPLYPSKANIDPERLRTYLDGRTDKSVPASVFMELLVHFRDDPATIKKIVFLEKKKGCKYTIIFKATASLPMSLLYCI